MEKDQKLNTSSKWKIVFGFVMLFLYFSYIHVPINSQLLDAVSFPLDVLFLIVMIPDIVREAKKIGSNKKSLLLIPLGAILVLGLQGFLWDNVVTSMIGELIGVSFGNDNTANVTEMVRNAPVFMGIMACIYGPILEELLYRYTAFGVLYTKNRFLAYAVSALLFGIQHVAEAGIWGGDLVQLINMPGYIMAGLAFAFVYDKSKNICIPIGAHIAANSVGLFMMMLSGTL